MVAQGFSFIVETLIQFMTYVIQIFLLPLNMIISELFPDLTQNIFDLSNNIVSIFDGMNWAVGTLPSSTVSILLLILVIEVAKYSIAFNLHMVTRIFGISASLHNKLGSFKIL